MTLNERHASCKRLQSEIRCAHDNLAAAVESLQPCRFCLVEISTLKLALLGAARSGVLRAADAIAKRCAAQVARSAPTVLNFDRMNTPSTSHAKVCNGPRLQRVLTLRDLIVYGIIVISPMAPATFFGVLSRREMATLPPAFCSPWLRCH